MSFGGDTDAKGQRILARIEARFVASIGSTPTKVVVPLKILIGALCAKTDAAERLEYARQVRMRAPAQPRSALQTRLHQRRTAMRVGFPRALATTTA